MWRRALMQNYIECGVIQTIGGNITADGDITLVNAW